MKQVELAVIGAGPAGLSAALAAHAAGLDVTVIDENPRPGGQIFRQMPESFQVLRPGVLGRTYEKGQDLLRKVSKSGILVRTNTEVWGLFEPLTLALQQGEKGETLACRALVLATGAYDRAAPFPGWTLPGVMMLGGAQTLVKSQRILPGKRIVLAGSGPFLLPVAAQLIRGGASIAAILEANGPREWMRKAPGLLGQWERMREAWEYLLPIVRARIPVRFGQTIVAAKGDERLKRVTVSSLDSDWRPRPGTEYDIEADSACIGFGFTINTQLSRLCGCQHSYRKERGGWVVDHDRWRQTSVAKVFVAGEVTGVAGADAALAEGYIAGLGAARALGAISDSQAAALAAPHRKRLSHMKPFIELMRRLFYLRAGLLDVITDETVVCRCEEVTAADVREAVRNGARDVNGVKSRARTGMGHCQGRVCGPIVAGLVARYAGVSIEEAGVFTARPIVEPVPLASIAATH